MASLHKTTTATAAAAAAAASTPSSTTLRFLGLLKLPEPDLTPLELHESDVVWSPDLSLPSPSSTAQSFPSHSTAVSNSSSPTNTFFRHHHHFHPDKSGLSAALSDDLHPLVRRKPNLSPSISAATAALTIPPVAIVSGSASGSSSFKYHQSAPVNVPIWQKKTAEASGKLGRFDDEIEIVEEEDEKEMIPPHEIVARTYVTFSVFEGAGRTLKGRDLRRVRNAVFQKTGFLD